MTMCHGRGEKIARGNNYPLATSVSSFLKDVPHSLCALVSDWAGFLGSVEEAPLSTLGQAKRRRRPVCYRGFVPMVENLTVRDRSKGDRTAVIPLPEEICLPKSNENEFGNWDAGRIR